MYGYQNYMGMYTLHKVGPLTKNEPVLTTTSYVGAYVPI
jgi:hypothetical protein